MQGVLLRPHAPRMCKNPAGSQRIQNGAEKAQRRRVGKKMGSVLCGYDIQNWYFGTEQLIKDATDQFILNCSYCLHLQLAGLFLVVYFHFCFSKVSSILYNILVISFKTSLSVCQQYYTITCATRNIFFIGSVCAAVLLLSKYL